VGPDTGQDNSEVYGALGISDAQLEELRVLKVI
jgi:hypothetical protein